MKAVIWPTVYIPCSSSGAGKSGRVRTTHKDDTLLMGSNTKVVFELEHGIDGGHDGAVES